MQRPVLRMLIVLGLLMMAFLVLSGVPSAAQQSPLGVTPTVIAGTATPVPVGGNLALVDRGAVLQATFGSFVLPAVAIVMAVGIVGFIVARRWPEN